MSPEAAAPPVLSVLVLNYNYGRFLGECVESILAQSFQDFELIILDDASSDGSEEVARPFERDPRVRFVQHEENRGFCASLIEGTDALSSGEFLMVVSSDDLALAPDAFASQLARLRAEPECGACVTAYAKLGPGLQRSVRRLHGGDYSFSGKEWIRAQLTDREFTPLHSGTMIRGEAYRAVGGYRSDLRNYVDLAMWLALGHQGPVAYIDRALFGYRVHPAQFSGSGRRRRDVLREGLAVLSAELPAARGAGVEVSRLRMLRARAADLALADAFAGRRQRAFQRCGDVLAVATLAALTAPGWWLALVRAAAGERGWAVLASIRRRLP